MSCTQIDLCVMKCSESVGMRIARELQMLFGHLQLGQQKSFNPRAFVKTLQLPTSVQQDAQEFNKLLLSKLEDTFNLSSANNIRHHSRPQPRPT